MTVPALTPDDDDGMNDLSRVLIEKLDEMLADLSAIKKGKILFIGLGNRDITPDAVGPMTMDRLRILCLIIIQKMEAKYLSMHRA